MTRKHFLAAGTRCVAEVSNHRTETPALSPLIWTKYDAHYRINCLNILNIRSRTGSHFSQASAASPHYYAAQTLFVCIQLYCPLSMAFGGGDFSFMVANTVPLLSGQGEEKHNGLSRSKALVPPLWLSHRCDVESTWNDNVDRENHIMGRRGTLTCSNAHKLCLIAP